MNHIIDPRSISFDKVLSNLENFVKTAPDWERWKDFFESDPGQIVIQLLAGVDTHLSYQIALSLREGFMYTALRLSSKIGIAETLGYSVLRGCNQRYKITITPSTTVSFPRLSVIGTVKNVDLVNIDSIDLVADQLIDIIVAPGLLLQEEFQYSTPNLGIARFISDGVSEDYLLSLNDIEVPTSSHIIDMVNDKYVILTNHLTGVDAFYLNQGAYQYKTGDRLSLRFIQTSRVVYRDTDLSFDFGIIEKIEPHQPFQPMESKRSIEITAPLYHETQNLIRGRSDYRKTFRLLDSNLSDTAEFDFSPAQVDLSYVYTSELLASKTQIQDYLTALERYRPFGVQPPSGILHPKRSEIPLYVKISRLANTTPAMVQTDVLALFEVFQRQFSPSLSFFDMEHGIEQSLDYVKVARVRIDAPWWQGGPFVEGSFCRSTEPSVIYKSTHINKTAATMPAWVFEPGALIQDGRILWQCDTYICDAIEYNPEMEVKYGQRVIIQDNCSYSFRCIDFVNKSGQYPPAWEPVPGSIMIDGEIVWRLAEQPGIPVKQWKANRVYRIGDCVAISNSDLVACVVNYARTSGPSEPLWPLHEGESIEDNEIRWYVQGVDTDPFYYPEGWNTYHVFDIDVTVA